MWQCLWHDYVKDFIETSRLCTACSSMYLGTRVATLPLQDSLQQSTLLLPSSQVAPSFNRGEPITREYYDDWMSGNSNPAIGERTAAHGSFALFFTLGTPLFQEARLSGAVYLCHCPPFVTDAIKKSSPKNRLSRVLPSIVEKLFPEMPADDQTALWKSKEEVYRLISTKMIPLPGLLAVLDRCRSQKLAMILVTNAPRVDAVHTLEVLNLSDRYGGWGSRNSGR